MKTVLVRLAGFTVLPLLSLVLPFVLLPVVARVAGPDGWASIVAGQAVGTFAGTVIAWSWNVAGPISIVRASGDGARRALYSESIRTRLLLTAAVVPASSLLTFIITGGEHRFDAVAMSWSTALAGLSPAWFGIGLGKPRLLAIFDTLPRFVAAIISAPVLLLTHQIWWYPLILAILAGFSLAVFQKVFGEQGAWLPFPLTTTVNELKASGKIAGINLSGNAYGAAPVPIATATLPPVSASAGFASVDTVYRLGLFAVVALGNALQGWVLEPGQPDPRRRQWLAVVAHAVLGLVAATALTLLGPWATELLFGAAVKGDPVVCLYYGVAFAFISASTPFIRNVLIPHHRQTTVLAWTLVTAVVGVVAMIAGGLAGSPQAIAAGVALSEALLFVALAVPTARFLKSGTRRAEDGAPDPDGDFGAGHRADHA